MPRSTALRGGGPRGRQAVRARVLLKCDAGETDAAVAAALDVSTGSVGRWRRQAGAEGPAAALARRAHPPRPCKLDGAGEAHLLQLAQSAPSAGYARWTLRLLARELAARGVGPRISHETVRRTLKNELTPWRRVQRCYPPVQEEAFVVAMEAVLDRYSRPYDARYPVICRDEHAKRLRADTRPSQPSRPGHPATYDYEYVRCGTCTIGIFVEPLGQWRTANATARRTGPWTGRTKSRSLVDHPRDREAERRILVCDNLNTHAYASFFRAFPRAEAERLVRRVQLVFTPRHGSWLHRAEPELSVLTRQALSPRRSTQDAVHAQVTAWAEDRHAAQKGIRWQFRTADARVRLQKLYPTVET